VIACDVDKAVLENPAADQALLMPDAQTIPVPSASVDLVVADYVLEHVAAPTELAKEIDRVLRPGGCTNRAQPPAHTCTRKVAAAKGSSRHLPNQVPHE
jgi:ubiquinone/menaquinone biosynthesis C-methylase UbiE